MRLSDLILEEERIESDFSFDMSNLNEAIMLCERAFFQKSEFDKLISDKKDQLEMNNPYKELLKNYSSEAWNRRDFGEEVRGMENATQLLSLVGDYKDLIPRMKEKVQEFEKVQKEFASKLSKMTKKADTIRDDDKSGQREFKKETLQLLKDRQAQLKKFEKDVKHYEPQLRKAYQKVADFEKEKSSSKNKQDTRSRARQNRSDAVQGAKSKISDSMSNSIDFAKSKTSDWKNRVKKMASAKSDK